MQASASAQTDQRLCYSLFIYWFYFINFFFFSFEITTSRLATSEILIFYLVSVAEETGLGLELDRFRCVDAPICLTLHENRTSTCIVSVYRTCLFLYLLLPLETVWNLNTLNILSGLTWVQTVGEYIQNVTFNSLTTTCTTTPPPPPTTTTTTTTTTRLHHFPIFIIIIIFFLFYFYF